MGRRTWTVLGRGLDRVRALPAEVAALFGSVHVSLCTGHVPLHEGIGALPGCCVAGSPELVAQVREWQRPLGGTPHGSWPMAASALHLRPERLAEVPARLDRARAIAAALGPVPAGVTSQLDAAGSVGVTGRWVPYQSTTLRIRSSWWRASPIPWGSRG